MARKRRVVFYFRMSGYLRTLKEPQEWEVAGPLITAANGVNGVKNGFNGTASGLDGDGFGVLPSAPHIKTAIISILGMFKSM